MSLEMLDLAGIQPEKDQRLGCEIACLYAVVALCLLCFVLILLFPHLFTFRFSGFLRLHQAHILELGIIRQEALNYFISDVGELAFAPFVSSSILFFT
jgi:hypothetical protein